MIKNKLKRLTCLAVACCLFVSFCQMNIFAYSAKAGTFELDNVALNKTVTAHDPTNKTKDLQKIVDGEKDNPNNFEMVSSDDPANADDPYYIQIDLEEVYDITQINMYRYWLPETNGDVRKYSDTVVLASKDDIFDSEDVVYNSDDTDFYKFGVGSDEEYSESSAGKSIKFNEKKVRYIRIYNNGNTGDWGKGGHYVEVEAYAKADEKPNPSSTFLPNADAPLTTPTPDNFGQVTQPDVVYIPEGFNGYTYYMVTTSFANNQGSAENPYILVSNDGINWERHTDNLLPPPQNSSWYQDPDLLYYNGEMRIYYYNEGGSGDGNIGWVKMLSSTDGKNWTQHQNPIYTSNGEKYGAFGLSVTAKDDKYTLWSVNAGNKGWNSTNSKVEYRVSDNGIDGWNTPTDITAQVTPAGYQPWHLNVEYIPEKEEYWMLLAAYPTANPDSNNCELFFAKSTDGKSWTASKKAILKASKDSNAWDSGCVYRSGFIYDAQSDMLKVWYGARKNLVWHVGYTEGKYSNLIIDEGDEELDKLSTDKKIYSLNENVIVSYYGAENDSWIGIYPKGGIPGSNQPASLAWKYTKDVAQPDGSITFNSATWGKVGDYEAIFFIDSGYTIAQRVSFSIKNESTEISKPTSIIYNRTATKRGKADGTITVSPAIDETSLSGYVLYWGNDGGKLNDYTPIAKLNKTGEAINYSVVKNTLIPARATKIMAYSVNGDVESAEYAEVAIRLNDVLPEEKPLYKFQIMSDIHVDKDDSHIHNKNFDNALKDIKAVASDSAGIFIVGDNTNNGLSQDYDKMKAIIKTNETGLPPIYHAMGNHDFYNDGTIERFKQMTGMTSHYYSEIISGQKFIVLGSDNKYGEDADINQTQMSWLESELANAPKNQPTYIFLHQPLFDTVAGSLPGQGWDGVKQDKELRAILKKYPNSILFTGHTHWELDSKSVMYDGKGGDATMFNDAACSYLWTDTSAPDSAGKVGSQGLFAEVYKDKVIVRGRDFVNRKWVSASQFLVDLSEGEFSKLQLDTKIAEANEILKNSNIYKTETFTNFQNALNEAKAISAQADAKPSDIDKAFLDLRISIFELREIPDKSKIEEMLKEAGD